MKCERIELYGDDIGAVEYIQHAGDDITVVNAARVSFGKEKFELDEKDLKLIKYLVKHKHTSVFEHNTITFRFTVPLYVRSQHMRHRTWSYNEISRRYTDVNLQFYEPSLFRTQHKSNRQASNEDELINPLTHYPRYTYSAMPASDAIKEHNKVSLELFNRLLKDGVCREQARGVLPQNMYTQYYGTVNLNNLLKFIELRIHLGAQWEIQRVAEACAKMALEIWPTTMKAYLETRNIDLNLNREEFVR